MPLITNAPESRYPEPAHGPEGLWIGPAILFTVLVEAGVFFLVW